MNTTPHDIPEAVLEVATRYLIEFDLRCCGHKPPPRELWAQFDEWLKADPLHALAWQQMAHTRNFIDSKVSPPGGATALLTGN